MFAALRGTVRFAATPGEVFLSVLGGSTLALILVIMGLLSLLLTKTHSDT
jgi:hypothetical protein